MLSNTYYIVQLIYTDQLSSHVRQTGRRTEYITAQWGENVSVGESTKSEFTQYKNSFYIIRNYLKCLQILEKILWENKNAPSEII